MTNGDVKNTAKTAALLIAHGTSYPAGRDEFAQLAELFRRREQGRIVEYAFLEKAQPDIPSAVDHCAEQGAKNIAVIPCFLGAGRHAALDIPGVLKKSQTMYPNLEFRCGGVIPMHPKIVELCQYRIEKAEITAGEKERNETLLIVLGGGSRRQDGNAEVYALTRTLKELLNFRTAETGFIANASPSFSNVLEQSNSREFQRILVFPYLLFHGSLFNRAKAISQRFLKKTGNKVLLTEPLNAHPLLCEALLQIHRKILSDTG